MIQLPGAKVTSSDAMTQSHQRSTLQSLLTRRMKFLVGRGKLFRTVLTCRQLQADNDPNASNNQWGVATKPSQRLQLSEAIGGGEAT